MRRLLSTTIVYTILSFLQGFVSLLLQPVYTTYLSSSQYAVFSMMNNLSNLVAITAALSVGNTFFTFYYDYQTDRAKLETFLGQLLSFSILVSAVVAIFLFFVGDVLFQQIFRDTAFQFYPYGCWAVLSGAVYTLIVPYVVLLRNDKNVATYAWFIITWVFATVVGQVVGMVYATDAINGALLGRLVGNTIGAAIVLWHCRRWLTWRLDTTYLAKPLRFAAFLLPGFLLEWGGASGDRFWVERWLSLSLLGVYSLLNVISATTEMASGALRMAIMPFLYESLGSNTPQSTEQRQHLYNFYTAIMVLAVTAVVFLVSHINYFIKNPDYLTLQPYVYLYVLGYLFSAISAFIIFVFFYHKNPKPNLYLMLGVISLNIALNYCLTPTYALWGVVAAATGARGVALAILIGFNPRLFAPFLKWRSATLLLSTVLCLVIAHFATYRQYCSHSTAGWAMLLVVVVLLLGMYRQQINQTVMIFKSRLGNR